MKKNIAKTIFIKFLKKNKIVGRTLLYFDYSIPFFTNISTNSQVLNRAAIRADKAKDDEERKAALRDMLGSTRSPKTIIKTGQDYLYETYLDWANYVNYNWGEIKQLYETYENKG